MKSSFQELTFHEKFILKAEKGFSFSNLKLCIAITTTIIFCQICNTLYLLYCILWFVVCLLDYPIPGPLYKLVQVVMAISRLIRN